jgi:hypothetical protein
MSKDLIKRLGFVDWQKKYSISTLFDFKSLKRFLVSILKNTTYTTCIYKIIISLVFKYQIIAIKQLIYLLTKMNIPFYTKMIKIEKIPFKIELTKLYINQHAFV